ncbi:hypothetical protein IFM89_009575, partial [Coptis chinensis]
EEEARKKIYSVSAKYIFFFVCNAPLEIVDKIIDSDMERTDFQETVFAISTLQVFSERIGHWKPAIQSQELFRTLQRYYSNAYMDAEKQDPINLLKGANITSESRIGKLASGSSRCCLGYVSWTGKSANHNAYIMIRLEVQAMAKVPCNTRDPMVEEPHFTLSRWLYFIYDRLKSKLRAHLYREHEVDALDTTSNWTVPITLQNGQIIHHHIEPVGRESMPQLPISDQMSRAKMKAMLEDVLHANASMASVISPISNGMYSTSGDVLRAFNDTVGHSSPEDQHTHSQVFETHMTTPGGVYYPQFELRHTSRRHSNFHGDSSFHGVRSTFQGDSSGNGGWW